MSTKVLSSCVVLVAVAFVGLSSVSAAPDDAASGAAAPKAEAKAQETENEWTLARVLALGRDEVFELWKQCPAATLEELNGHYMGLIPNADDPVREKATNNFMYNENSARGYWCGKAYKATSATKGEGYNRWRFPGGKIVRNGRFATEMGTSLIDGKPALMMYYQAFNPQTTLTDEIRKLAHDVYLGMGTTELANGERSEPGHFALYGPTDEWVGPGKIRTTE